MQRLTSFAGVETTPQGVPAVVNEQTCNGVRISKFRWYMYPCTMTTMARWRSRICSAMQSTVASTCAPGANGSQPIFATYAAAMVLSARCLTRSTPS